MNDFGTGKRKLGISISDTGMALGFKQVVQSNFMLNMAFVKPDAIITDDLSTEEYTNLKNIVGKVRISGSLEQIITFVKNNIDFLKDKEIDFFEMKNISFDDDTKEKFKILNSLIPQAKYQINGNTEYVDANLVIQTVEKINKIAILANRNDLSPLEKIMVYFDIVRHRIYNREGEDENHRKSRDLTQVLTGDNIVCLGYANELRVLLEKSNIPGINLLLLTPNGPGHARNLVYVNDPKYHYEGLLQFDATFCSRREEDDLEYRNQMFYFGCTYNEAMKRVGNRYAYDTYEFFDRESIDESQRKQLIESEFVDILQCMGIEIPINDLYDGDIDKINVFVSLIHKLCNQEIPKKTFLKLLYNVRRFEYSLDPEWSCFTEDDIITAFENKYYPKLNNMKNEEILLRAILGQDTTWSLEDTDMIEEFLNSIDMEKDYARINFLQTLNAVKTSEENGLKR